MDNDLKNKKVLLLGLGILGGGVSTARWLVGNNAILTITDLKSSEHLASSLRALEDLKDKITFVLGRHEEKDILENDIIVINPDVPLSSPYIKFAQDNKKQIENELTLFYKYCPHGPVVAITGTRGKTTTSSWSSHFIKSTYADSLLLGNSPDRPLLAASIQSSAPCVIETPSFLLEHSGSVFKPKVAVITNIYQDHLNRYQDLQHYAATKAAIFSSQDKDDYLILNKDNSWTDFFLGRSPQSKVLFFSQLALPPELDGTYVDGTKIMLRLNGNTEVLGEADKFIDLWGQHNLQNLLPAALAAILMDVPVELIKKNIHTLPQIKFRQERIYQKAGLEIYNDTAATSPEATIAALQRFAGRGSTILIAGGTNRELDFKQWAEAIKAYVKEENLILLEGSATELMKQSLGWKSYNEFGTLKECLDRALELSGSQAVILFSPGSKSFEKFKNEFDRGEQFNTLVRNHEQSIK